MNRCLCNRRNQWENGPCDLHSDEPICSGCQCYESTCNCPSEDEIEEDE